MAFFEHENLTQIENITHYYNNILIITVNHIIQPKIKYFIKVIRCKV